MCAADVQFRWDMADGYELTMNFTSGQLGGAQDYQVNLFCWNFCFVLLMSNLGQAWQQFDSEFHLWTSWWSSGLPGELTLLEFLFASYKQLAYVCMKWPWSHLWIMDGAQDCRVERAYCVRIHLCYIWAAKVRHGICKKTDHEFHLWTREWS